MQGQKIQNPETQVPNTPMLNDRDCLDLILNMEKKMVSGYTTALTEASNDHLYQEIFKIFQETQEKQRCVYTKMFQKGWYSIEPEQKQKIDQAHQKFQGYKPQIVQ